MQASPTFNLLDLPDAALSITIASLAGSDRKMIMAACRKTFDMTMLNAEITVKVTKGSKFAGFQKVLNSTSPASMHLVITCPDCNSKNLSVEPLSTIAVLMGMTSDSTLTQLAASCQGKAWERITKVTIKGTMMRCLVPKFIALACPSLVHLKLMKPYDAAWDTHIFSVVPGDALPLTLCSGLKQLDIDSFRPNLPLLFHIVAELRHSLPSVDTLIFATCHNADLISAFATQLTRLEMHHHRSEGGIGATQQLVRPCSKLQHLCVPELVLPGNTANLKVLELSHMVTDGNMRLLLQLPSLTELHLPNLYNIQQDWSKHACPWRTLHLKTIAVTQLANVNLSSLQQVTARPDVVVCLPEPDDPNGLSEVQYVVDSLSHIGKVMFKENNETAGTCYGESGTVSWHVSYSGSESEQRAAELIAAAAQLFGPCRVCSCRHLANRPLLLNEVMKWGQTFIESVFLGDNYDPQPHVWQALQQLDRLNTVVFWGFKRLQAYSRNHGDGLINMACAISSAAHQYVLHANRSLRIECGISNWNLEPAEVTQCKALLCSAIQNRIPAGCKLASVEFYYMEGHDHYTQYGGRCTSTAFWVVVLKPLQPTP